MIGGGPGGSTVATLLARAGWRVVCCERERFPRFRVGESLLPANWHIFERLGVIDRLQDAGTFIRKHGAVFHDGDSGEHQRYRFEHAFAPTPNHAWQVERATFDHLLLQNAAAAGVDVREGWRVEHALAEGERVRGVAVVDPEGGAHELTAPVVIDASGRDTLLATQFGLRVPHPRLRKGALYAHMEGVARPAGVEAGDIHIVRWTDGWAWVIPLASGRTSVGLVMHGRRFKERGDQPLETFFERCCADAPVLHALLGDAQRVGPVHAVSNISYETRRQAGPGWVLVGDAAVFLDPVFSSGVLLAMSAAELVAADLLRAGRGAPVDAGTVRRALRKLSRAHRIFFPMIEGFYDPSFFDRFMRPVAKFGIQAGVTSLLAGDVFRRWPHIPLSWIFWWGVSRTRKERAAAGLPVASMVTE